MKNIVTASIAILSCYSLYAQTDTTSFPEERQAVRQLMHESKPGTRIDCNDFIAVGPKGDISFSFSEWKAAQIKQKVVFKSVVSLPGHEFIRIYDGNTAVVNFLANVHLVVDGQDVRIKVRRLEVYHKSTAGWCRVAGQGTIVDETLFPVERDKQEVTHYPNLTKQPTEYTAP